jgi:hypothetical protein
MIILLSVIGESITAEVMRASPLVSFRGGKTSL